MTLTIRGTTTRSTTTGQINTDTRQDQQKWLKYVANIYNNLAKKTMMWTRGNWKDISTAFKTCVTAKERIFKKNLATRQQGRRTENKVMAKVEREAYSNKTQIMVEETDIICETAAKIKIWSAAKDHQYTCKKCISAALGQLTPAQDTASVGNTKTNEDCQ